MATLELLEIVWCNVMFQLPLELIAAQKLTKELTKLFIATLLISTVLIQSITVVQEAKYIPITAGLAIVILDIICRDHHVWQQPVQLLELLVSIINQDLLTQQALRLFLLLAKLDILVLQLILVARQERLLLLVAGTAPSGTGYADQSSLPYAAGGAGSFACSSGYLGSKSYTCLTSGVATSIGGTCTPITCTIAAANGFNAKSGLAYATSATAISSPCQVGYTGSPTYTCTTTGAASISGSCIEPTGRWSLIYTSTSGATRGNNGRSLSATCTASKNGKYAVVLSSFSTSISGTTITINSSWANDIYTWQCSYCGSGCSTPAGVAGCTGVAVSGTAPIKVYQCIYP